MNAEAAENTLVCGDGLSGHKVDTNNTLQLRRTPIAPPVSLLRLAFARWSIPGDSIRVSSAGKYAFACSVSRMFSTDPCCTGPAVTRWAACTSTSTYRQASQEYETFNV
jgi:hypothetical protein